MTRRTCRNIVHMGRALAVLVAFALAVSLTGLTARGAGAVMNVQSQALHLISDAGAGDHAHTFDVGLSGDRADCDGAAGHHGDAGPHGGSCCDVSCHAVLLARVETVSPLQVVLSMTVVTVGPAPTLAVYIDRPPRTLK